MKTYIQNMIWAKNPKLAKIRIDFSIRNNAEMLDSIIIVLGATLVWAFGVNPLINGNPLSEITKGDLSISVLTSILICLFIINPIFKLSMFRWSTRLILCLLAAVVVTPIIATISFAISFVLGG